MKPTKNQHSAKYIIITGGVLSGLGKGVLTASIGALMKSAHTIVPIKLDGYLNADTGTMNPIEHGEVFVLDDGGEVDMDFGHYERFIGVKAKRDWNITMGKVYKQILDNEREGKYLGETVQLIPHATDEIKERIFKIAKTENPDIILIEIGGTVGDIENELFIEAIRQLRNNVGRENTFFIHLTYVPFITGSKEFKSKPTQNSIRLLHQSGIYPDAIICRCPDYLNDTVKSKIALHGDIDEASVMSGIDVKTINELPLYFEKQGISKLINQKLKLHIKPYPKRSCKLIAQLKKFENIDANTNNHNKPNIKIAICGKYTHLEDSYASIGETLKHCSAHLKVAIELVYLNSIEVKSNSSDAVLAKFLANIDGVIIPGGFGKRGVEGKIRIIKYLRENKLPFLGICLGMQLTVIEHARHVGHLSNAYSEEQGVPQHSNNPTSKPMPVVAYLPNQKEYVEKKGLGGTMRLGGHDVKLKPNTLAKKIFKTNKIRKRFRHRYEVNPAYVKELEKQGLVFSGMTLDEKIMQIVEIPQHPFFFAVQFHPELDSHLDNPAKEFLHFTKVVKKLKYSKKASTRQT